jgi:TrmH family RNA methyltransferase
LLFPENSQALRAARGGVFRLPLARLSWEELETLTTSRGLVRYCAEPTAPDAVGADAAVSAEREGVCLVLGSEGQGLSETALRTCRPVAIPMPGEMESLNVGVAGGILMYLMRKER